MPEWIGEAMALLTGPTGVLVVFVYIAVAGARGHWVWGRELTASEKRADEWHALTATSLTAIQAAIEALERRVPR